MPHSMWEKAKLYIPSGGVLSGWLVDYRPTILPCDISSTRCYSGAVTVRRRGFQMNRETKWAWLQVCSTRACVCIPAHTGEWMQHSPAPKPWCAKTCFPADFIEILSLLILYSDLFHVIYTKGLLKSWINFGVKFWFPSNMSGFHGLLHSQNYSVVSSRSDFLALQKWRCFITPSASSDKDEQSYSFLRNLFSCLCDCLLSALHRWEVEFGLILRVTNGDLCRTKGPKPANNILGRFEECNSFYELSIFVTQHWMQYWI